MPRYRCRLGCILLKTAQRYRCGQDDETNPTPPPLVIRFLDDSVLVSNASGRGYEVGDGMELRANRPTKMGLIYKPTEPWEVYNSEPGKVMGPFAEGPSAYRYRIYYKCWQSPAGGGPQQLRSGQGMPDNLIASTQLCLIVSDDGKAWRRPNLGLATWNASTDNNIVWPLEDNSACGAAGKGRQQCPAHNAYVFHDDNPATPAAERFKLFSHQPMPGHENQTGAVEKGKEGVCVMWPLGDDKKPLPNATSWCPTILVSADGLNFRPPPGGLRVSTYQRYGSTHTDCQLQFWDQAAGKYIAGCQMPCITIINGRENFTCLT